MLRWIVLAATVLAIPQVWAQEASFTPDWFVPGQPHVKIGVVQDGIYAVTAADLRAAGVEPATVDVGTLALLENGTPVPTRFTGPGESGWADGDTLVFVGGRNTGADEAWAWTDLDDRSSSYFSLYSDTTFYWLTWGGTPGPRYRPSAATPTTPRSTLRTTTHLERDVYYYFGDSHDSAQPMYTRGEGYYWERFSVGTSPVEKTFAIPAEHLVLSDDSLRLAVRLSSESAPPHRLTLEVEVADGATTRFEVFDEAAWSGYRFVTLTAALPQRLLPTGRDAVTLRVTSHVVPNSTPNRVLLDWVEASFVRALVLDPETPLRLAVDAGTHTFALSTEPGRTVHLYDPMGETYSTAVADPDGRARLTVDVEEPGTLWAVAGPATQSPVRLSHPPSRDWADASLEADYVIITTPLLRASAETFAAYRSDRDGMTVTIVDQQDIFDRFDYGRPTPIAIRRFLRASQTWRRAPAYLMLWGDLLRPFDDEPRRPLGPWEVISFGYAPADGWLAMELAEGDYTEALAVGRIPLRQNAEGQLFVDKLRRYESAPREAWQKRVLQLAGGFTEGEQRTLQSYTTAWGAVASAPPMGADTLTFFKNANATLDPTFQDSLRHALREGAGWLTYFGHSAADSWEIVTDPPEEFDNADRLPVVLSLGCNTGNVAGGQFEAADRMVLGERLVIGSANGSIAHWGSSSPSTITLPGILAHELHEVVFADTVRVLGEALRTAKARFIGDRTLTDALRRVVLQYGLIGDPATRLDLPTAPDLHLPAGAIRIAPEAPTPADSSLAAAVRIENHGLVPADSIDVQVLHVRPAGEPRTFARRLPPVVLRDTASFRVPIDSLSVGQNELRVTVDPLGTSGDADPADNSASRTTTIFATGLSVITPVDLALVTSRTPRLRVGLSPQATVTTIAFELDTTATFDSPARQTATVPHDGLAATWTPASLEAGQSYVWRARPVEAATEENWTRAVFTVDPAADASGWMQKGPLLARTTTDPFLAFDDGRWQMQSYNVEVRVTSERGYGFEKGQIVVNGEQFEKFTLGFGVVVLDGATGRVRATASLPTYQLSDGLIPAYGDSTDARERFDALLDEIRPGDYIFVRTRHLGRKSSTTIQPHIKARWRSLGSTAIDTLSYKHLWIMMARAGSPESVREWAVSPTEAEINEIAEETTVSFTFPEGVVTSPRIGPAEAWDRVRGTASLANGASSVRLDVLRADADSVLVANVELPGTASLATLDARRHPYVRLRATLRDTSQRSTPQLDGWSVTYTPVAELAARPSALTLSADTLAEGQPLEVGSSIVNLGPAAAPEAVVHYTLTDASNREVVVARDTVLALGPDAAAASRTTIDTDGLVGSNQLRIRVEQPGRAERVTYNNVLLRSFAVAADRERPTFDVTVDGQAYPHAEDPVTNLQDPTFPFVGVHPRIEVTVTDGNLFKPLADTSVVQVTFDGRRVALDDPAVTFIPAGDEGTEARLLFEPDLSGRDTTHTLVVRAFDASGNEAAGSPYQIHFRVQQAVTVETLYPYPNPMSAATRFAFLLRGADVGRVDDFRIRVFTLTGRLVREFDLVDEPGLLAGGGLRIGWNSLPWDGRDADGDLLSTGVYLYKVYLRAEGRSLAVNNADGIEKLVVLR